jgi:hypothetical protein
MKKTILILSFLILVFFAFNINANTPSAIKRWDTIDLQPAVGFHSGAPVRIKVDKIVSVSPMVTVSNAKINNTAGYPLGATSININNISSVKPVPGRIFAVGTSGDIYTVVTATDITGGMTVTFTPPLIAAAPNLTNVIFKQYYTAVHFDFDRIYYDKREYHVMVDLLNRTGWGDVPVERFTTP